MFPCSSKKKFPNSTKSNINSLLAFVEICLIIISEWPPLVHRLLWFCFVLVNRVKWAVSYLSSRWAVKPTIISSNVQNYKSWKKFSSCCLDSNEEQNFYLQRWGNYRSRLRYRCTNTLFESTEPIKTSTGEIHIKEHCLNGKWDS